MTLTETSKLESTPEAVSSPTNGVSPVSTKFLIIEWENILINSQLNQRISWKQAIAWYNNNFEAHLDETEFHDTFHLKYFPFEGTFSSLDKVGFIFSKLNLDLGHASIFLNVYRNYYRKRTYQMLKNDKSGILEYLTNLSNQNTVRVGIISDNSIQAKESYLYILLQLGIADIFDFFICTQEISDKKQSIISSCIEKWESDTSNMLYLGNNLKYKDEIQKNGVKFAYVQGYKNGEMPDDDTIPIFGELTPDTIKNFDV